VSIIAFELLSINNLKKKIVTGRELDNLKLDNIKIM